MATKKLTLSVDPQVIAAAKRYAARRGTSVSRLVQAYLSAVAEEPPPPTATPVLARLRGVLNDASIGDYQSYLADKYGCSESSST